MAGILKEDMLWHSQQSQSSFSLSRKAGPILNQKPLPSTKTRQCFLRVHCRWVI